MRLCVMSLAALKASEIGVQTAVGCFPDDVDVAEAGLHAARDVYPESDGWHDHYASVTEITQDFPLDPYRLSWSLVDVRNVD